MKLNISKFLVISATLIFTVVVGLKFMTIQSMDTSDSNYFLYNIDGEKLFEIDNDNNNTFVEIYDNRVSLRGFFENGEDNRYRVLPYSFIDINTSQGSLTYQFLADSSKKSFSYPVRFKKFEIVGGSRFGYAKSLVRLHKNDKPLLILLPKEGKPIFGKTNDGIRVVALQEGLVYIDNRGVKRELPLFNGDIHQFENELKSGELDSMPIADDGVISSTDRKLVLNLSISDGVVSKKYRGGYREVKTKYLNITEYSQFEDISKLVLTHASREFYIKKDDNITYLNAPYEIPINSRVVVKGKNTLFGFDKYCCEADFTVEVPRLDKPKVTAKEVKSSRYYDFLDIDNMYGIFVSDKNAKVFYSKDGKRWIRGVENYKYAPPVYLYDQNIKGQFIAPKPFKNFDGKMYYKIVSTLPSYQIAFNGKLKIGSNPTIDTTHKDLITINKKEVVLEAIKGRLEECGTLFSLSDRRNLSYSFGDEVKREFNIEYKEGKYLYKIQEILDPFRSYNISVKGYKNFKYTPQLSCKYLSKSKPKDILST
jgi:hypothetical protein